MKRTTPLVHIALTVGLFFAAPLPAAGQAADQARAQAAAQALQEAQQQLLSQPQLNVGLFSIRPDGTIGGSASDTTSAPGEPISGVLYMAPCGSLGTASAGAIPASATDVWRLSGQLSAIGSEQATATVVWQRVREAGKDVDAPAQSVTLTLNRKDRTTLERVNVPARGSCEARTVSLDVVFGSRLDLYPRLASLPASVRVAGGGGIGSSSAGGTARVGGAVGGGGGGGVANFGGGSTGGVAAVRVGSGSGPRFLSADLWLVRSAAGQADQTSHLTADVAPFPRSFVFAPISVRTSAGVLTVTVQGTVETGQTPDGEHHLFFSANRTVTFAPANGPVRDSAPIVEGSTKTSVPMPGPDDVLSFEMPPLRVPGGAVVPDQLSIRVRVAPANVPGAPR
jgi:hypothetical protein